MAPYKKLSASLRWQADKIQDAVTKPDLQRGTSASRTKPKTLKAAATAAGKRRLKRS